MKQKPAKCRVCKQEYVRQRIGQKVCSIKCSIAQAADKVTKDTKKANIAAKREFYANDKKYVEKRARSYFHRWIKWRDRDLPCCACGRSMNDLPSRAIHACHYRPSGQNSAIRYHEWNVNLGCSQCNTNKSGNITEYRILLVEKIGVEAVEWLESQNHVYRWTIEELREVRDEYANRLKSLGIQLPTVH